MVIDTNGSIRLTLEYPSCNENMPRSGSGSRIHGVIEGEFVVLLECERTSWFVEGDPTFTNINKDMYSPQYCIMRQCLEYNYFPEEAKINFNCVDDIEFDTLYFTLSLLIFSRFGD